MSKVNTINVVEILDNRICGIHSFLYMDDAKRCFKRILKEHGINKLSEFIEDGEYEDNNGYVIQIVSSV